MSTEADRPRVECTIQGQIGGYLVTIAVAAKLSDLPALVDRLRAVGVEPVSGGKSQQARPAHVEPVYQPDGTACCPHHLKPLKQGRHGLFCTAKEPSGEYCKFTTRP